MYSGFREEHNGQNEHQDGPYDPVLHERKPRFRLLRKTSCNSSYRTLVNGGYIMRMSPTAIGIEVVPMLKRFRNGTTRGQPSQYNPHDIAVKIQPVR